MRKGWFYWYFDKQTYTCICIANNLGRHSRSEKSDDFFLFYLPVFSNFLHCTYTAFVIMKDILNWKHNSTFSQHIILEAILWILKYESA